MRNADDVVQALAGMGDSVVAIANAIGMHVVDDDTIAEGRYEVARANRMTFIYVSPRADESTLACALVAAMNHDGQLHYRASDREVLAERLVALLAGHSATFPCLQEAESE